MTNPYGTDPRSQPQGLGDPGNQGPQFIAPGAPGTPGQYGPSQYGPSQYGPPQYGPPQYGQAQGQPYGQPGPYGAPGVYGAPAGPGPGAYPPPSQPYAPGQQQPYGTYAAGPPTYTPSPRKRSGGWIVLVVVVLVALVTGIGFGASVLFQGTPKPVTQQSPARPAKTASGGTSASVRPTATGSTTANGALCASGDTITTARFVALVPANWSCDGDDGDISISSTNDDAIWVEHGAGTGDLAVDCKTQVEDIGNVTPLPQETWGGKAAISYTTEDSDGILGVRCAIAGGQTWYLLYIPFESKDDAKVRTDVTTVMKTWVWK